jgi:aerobic-type carbon monoxide dehydrogenase small subunit (CoxS/CutS family)
LLEVLRDEFKLFGAREGCGIGMCGACTVLLDGQLISSCLLLAPLAEGKAIVTIEGLSDPGKLHPIQQAFIDHNAFQCSYCTPGFILSTKSLLEENPAPTVEQIRAYLAGNLCRCGSYYKIQGGGGGCSGANARENNHLQGRNTAMAGVCKNDLKINFNQERRRLE